MSHPDLDRRQFLGLAGAGAGGVMASSGGRAASLGTQGIAPAASTCWEPAKEIPVLAEYDFQGIWHEWARKLGRMEGVRTPVWSSGQLHGSVDPEKVKLVWDELLSKAGAAILHHVFAATAIVERGVAKGVFVETKAGRRAILTKRVIDTTGDGIVAAAAGVPWDQGDGQHKYAMALTKVFRLGNVRKPAGFPNAAAMEKLEADLAPAIQRREYDSPVVTEKRRLLGYIRSWAWEMPAKRQELFSVISRVLKVDPLDPFDLTRAEREGREQARQAADFYCRYVPGCEEAYLLDTSNHIGVRSSRRLHGLATVTFEDAWNLRKYPDSIARSSWDLDVWPADGYAQATVPRNEPRYKERAEKVAAGDYFDIRPGLCESLSGQARELLDCRARSSVPKLPRFPIFRLKGREGTLWSAQDEGSPDR